MSTHRNVGDWIDDRYEVFEVHTGGMGVVFVVYDHRGEPGRRVLALKTLLDEYLTDDRQIKRFIAECDTWIKLDRHPYIVRAFSVQMIEGKPYVVLELVTGGDLRRWIGSSRLNLPQALRFGIHFCLAMEHAVMRGLRCHRDVKPENLLVTEGGTLKVTDFGLAKVRDEGAGPGSRTATDPIPLAQDDFAAAEGTEEEVWAGDWGDLHATANTRDDDTGGPGDAETFLTALGLDVAAPGNNATADFPGTIGEDEMLDPEGTVTWCQGKANDRDGLEKLPPGGGLTRAGAILGTGPYMAPEQFRNARNVNYLADIYSFGIVLFEMIATHPPFQAKSFSKLAQEHAKVKPPSLVPFLTGRYTKVAKHYDKIVQRCLEKDPMQRFASFRDLRQELSRVLWWAAAEKVTTPTETQMDAWELISRGVALAALGRLDEERQTYEDAIRFQPDYTPAWFNQAAVLGAQGRLAEAVEYADLALHLNPGSVPALINKGLALNALGRSQDAIACFDTAAHIQPRDPEVWSGRVIVLLGLGNTEGARVALNQYHRLRPDDGSSVLRSWTAPAAAGQRLKTTPWVRRTEDTPRDPHSRT